MLRPKPRISLRIQLQSLGKEIRLGGRQISYAPQDLNNRPTTLNNIYPSISASWSSKIVARSISSLHIQHQHLHQQHTTNHQHNRTFSTTPSRKMSTSPSTEDPNTDTQAKKKDWSATQYLKFGSQRTRAVHDLISQLAPHIDKPNPVIWDLGCGPGNSTSALLDAFPGAHVTGLDSSEDMLAKARKSVPGVRFELGDVGTFSLESGGGVKEGSGGENKVDLLFSNAVFHWLRHPSRLPALSRLFTSLPKGGILAIQVPDNYHAPSHELMRTTATLQNKPWSKYFSSIRIGDLSDATRPDLDPIEPPSAFYNALVQEAESVDIWRTNYQHPLADAGAIVEWVKGTGLQPYLHRIEDEEAKGEFLKEYERLLAEAYPELSDGKMLLEYPRLFVVAVRK